MTATQASLNPHRKNTAPHPAANRASILATPTGHHMGYKCYRTNCSPALSGVL